MEEHHQHYLPVLKDSYVNMIRTLLTVVYLEYYTRTTVWPLYIAGGRGAGRDQ